MYEIEEKEYTNMIGNEKQKDFKQLKRFKDDHAAHETDKRKRNKKRNRIKCKKREGDRVRERERDRQNDY